MKKITLLFMLIIIFIGIASSQNYEISFSANNGLADLKSIKIKNLTKGTEALLSGNQNLILNGPAKINESELKSKKVISYPNPFIDKTTIEFEIINTGLAKISVFDIRGRLLVDNIQNVERGNNSFEISGLTSGVYFCVLHIDNKEFYSQIISQNSTEGFPEIRFINRYEDKKNILTSAKIVGVSMNYSEGDLLLATGYTQEEASVMTFIPTECCNINFEMHSCKDRSGNSYKTVRIGNQVWMAENLRTTRFNDSTEIYHGIDNWGSLNQASYCWFNHNEEDYGYKYGALYNFYAINHEKNICPNGWHVPTDLEFSELQSILYPNSGSKLKDNGFAHWQSSNTSGTNESGFTALPSGYRGGLGGYLNEYLNAYFWTSTPSLAGKAWIRELSYENNNLNITNMENYNGLSVRCVKD